jgi:hypothetical protein
MKEGLKIKDQIEKQKPGLSLSFDNSDKNIPLGSQKDIVIEAKIECPTQSTNVTDNY